MCIRYRFTDIKEPTEVGVYLMAGSLIKNIGGGIAPTGGYAACTVVCIERLAQRLTAPSIGREVGSYAYGYQSFYQGLFMAPTAAVSYTHLDVYKRQGAIFWDFWTIPTLQWAPVCCADGLQSRCCAFLTFKTGWTAWKSLSKSRTSWKRWSAFWVEFGTLRGLRPASDVYKRK